VIGFVKEAVGTLTHGVNNLGQPEVQQKMADIAKQEEGEGEREGANSTKRKN
jgi:hypothetical protein